MKKIIFTLILLCVEVALSQAPNWSWVKKSSGDINEAFATVTTDSNGNIYGAGSVISENANFGLGVIPNNGYADYFIVKYNPTGTPVFMKYGGGTGNDIVYNLTTDSNNNLYALVHFQSQSIAFGSFSLTNSATTPDFTGLLTYDLALVKYDANGNELWVKKIGGTGAETATNLVCDASNNVYLTGLSVSQNLSAGNLSVSAATNNVVGGFMAKFAPNGNDLWIKRFGNDNNANEPTLAKPVFDTSGNFYLTGSFSSSAFTLGNTTYTNVEPGLSESFIAKFDSNGNILWQKAIQGNGNEQFGNILLIQNELFVKYTINAQASIGSSTYSYNGINYNNPSQTAGGFIKMNNSGQLISFINNPNIELFVTDGTSIYYTGGTTNTSIPVNIYVTKMTTSGQVLWTKNQTGTNGLVIYDLAINSTGDLFFGGYFGGSNLALDTFSLNNTSFSGFIDAVLAKLNSTLLTNSSFEKESITLYPNPTNDFIYINSGDEIKEVSVIDISGKIIANYHQNYIDLSELEAGLYSLKILTQTGSVLKKVIKK